MPRKRIAVITARADDNEQKAILAGIAEAAFSLDTDVVVFSNIYNHWVKDEQLNFENIIYDFFEPSLFDGAIITAEAFMDMGILDGIVEKIKKSKLSAVVIGGELEGFESVFSNDADDMEKIAEHLITVHNFTDIAILTGFEDNPEAQRRVEGCKRAFYKHSIAFDESKVYYGNFWSDSGETFAQRYISGELSMPQAVICTNDYMAYGLCDALTSAGVKIPEQLTVTGYDHNGGRIYHYPVLTSYKRNRRKMGIDAVNKISGCEYLSEDTDRFVSGNTCLCGAKQEQLADEMNSERISRYHTIMSSVAQLSSRLTLCRTLSEYTASLNEFFYLLHGTETLYLCLDTAWNSLKYEGEEFLCCEINGKQSGDTPEKFSREVLLPVLKKEREKPMMFYFSPLHFQTRLLGYTALCYDYPAGYDFSFRDWNKTVANTLEFLRMKNDIHYLTQCQRVSSLYDSLTGFYNLREFRQIVQTAFENSKMLALKMSFSADGEYLYGENYRSDIISAVAQAVKQACQNHEICCRASEDSFIILFKADEASFFDKLNVMIHHALIGKYDENQVVITFSEQIGNDIKHLCEVLEKNAVQAAKEFQIRKDTPHYKNMLEIRNSMMSSPKNALDIDEASRKLCVSEGYFRAVYKKCFGISYVQDMINAKILLASYLLCTTAMSVYMIALRCGYTDEKYFARQFRQIKGCSPAQYRGKLC